MTMVWVKPRLKRRINLGFYETLEQELRLVDESDYKKILHMTPQNFDDGYFGTYQDNTTETSTNTRDSRPANISRNNTVFGYG